VSRTFKKSMRLTTENPFVWVVVALRLRRVAAGPRGYRLMLKRQQQGASVSDPALVEATIRLLSATHPEQPASTWSLLRDGVREGWQNVDRRLLEHGPLEPDLFNLQETNERLATFSRRGRNEP
jgi:hypothetical protein